MPGDLLLRPEYEPDGAVVGLGHVARCVALGQAWVHRGGAARLVAAGLPDLWLDRCAAAGIGVSAASDAMVGPGGWTVFDGYHVTLDDQRAARAGGGRVVVIDDHGSLGRYDADLVLDQNLGATADRYPADVPLLLGPSYLLLRDEPVDASPAATGSADDGPTVLLAGGGQPDGTIARLLDTVADRLAGDGVRVTWLAGARDVAGLLRRADVAVSAAGTTAYELCAAGTPGVLTAVADNQLPVAQRLAAAGAAEDLGPVEGVDVAAVVATVQALLADPARRRAMSEAGRRVVDGRGAARVVAQLRSFDVALREAGPDDCRRVWRWSNDPEVREQSLSTAPIPWDDHLAWFDRQVADPDRLLLVAEVDGRAIGQIRFDATTDPTALSFSLSPSARGAGWGAPLLVAGTRHLRSRAPGREIVAVVRSGNGSSLASFDRAGYELLGVDPDAPEAADDAVVRFRSSDAGSS